MTDRLNDITSAAWDAANRKTLYQTELTFGDHEAARLKRPQPPHGYSYAFPETPSNITNVRSDGSTASYYELPAGAREIQDLIAYKDMNAQVGEIFRECYRYGQAAHCDKLRGAKKMKFYVDAEIKRLEGLA